MDMLGLIAKRRDGLTHTEAELQFLAQAAAQHSVPDYQLSAWLMAAYLQPLTEQETAWLTLGMARSGDTIDLTGLPKPWVDKHSTGGVGDKTSLVLLPLLAACGLTVVKMSGRGLGITGGTVDKLTSVPGFRMDLSPEEMKAQAAEIGLAITGQSPDLAPADRALYALRDATATVESMPLIVSSILSKKIAGGADVVVLDVKCGSGAFMKTLPEAQELAEWLVRIGLLAGLKVGVNISDMDQPLGSAVGNALEVAEALTVLRGEKLTPPVERFRRLCIYYAAFALWTSGFVQGEKEGQQRAEEALSSGAALEKARLWFRAQGGDIDAALPHAPVVRTLQSTASGWLARADAETIGQAVVDLGGGRKTKDDEIDSSVGVEVLNLVGDKVKAGQTLATIHAANGPDADEAAQQLRQAFEVSGSPVDPRPLFLPVA